ncbi:MAG: VWA domain-containing protein [Candidatus Acidiferrales bacterium]
MRRLIPLIAAVLFAASPALAQEQKIPMASHPQEKPVGVIRTGVSLIVIDAEVTGRDGLPVRGLKVDQFTVLEDGKPQKIVSFVYSDIQALETAAKAGAGGPSVVVPLEASAQTTNEDLSTVVRDHRMILLFFDLSSMGTDDLLRARDAAMKFVKQQMSAADLVSVVVLGSDLTALCDFTNDRATLEKAVAMLTPGISSQLAGLSAAPAQGGEYAVSEDTGAAYTPDDTEFNIFNTDRKLAAMQGLADQLQHIPGKKIVMQFTGGITQTGEENRTELQAATDAANRANVSFYTVDARGLMSEIPGGDATQDAATGTSMFSGAAVYRQTEARQDSRDTLTTFAEDTGGRAFFDIGDLGQAFKQVQDDTAGYYLIGYSTSNTKTDGAWRRVTLKVKASGVHLRYRDGYFAPRDFKHMSTEDRDEQLEEALRSDSPRVELPIALEVSQFRLANGEVYVPIAAKLPSGALQWAAKRGSQQDEFDFAAQVEEAGSRHIVAQLRDTISVRLDAEHFEAVHRNALLYQGGMILAPGTYKLKFVARENETGRIGTFEQDLSIPAADNKKLALSSVLLSSQLAPVVKSSEVQVKTVGVAASLKNSPLEFSGERLIPSVTNVFRTAQTIYVFFQAYLPHGADPSMLRGGLVFFRDGVEVSRTPLLAPVDMDAKAHSASFRISLPPGKFPLGNYAVQAVAVEAGEPLVAFGRAYMAVNAAPPAPAVAPAPQK